MKPARLRHVAFVTPNQRDLAAFYTSACGMKSVDQETPEDRVSTGIHLSDGKVNFTILRERPNDDRPRGFFHLGFAWPDEEFKDLKALNHRLRDAGASCDLWFEPEYSDLEHRLCDPDGNFIDIAPTRRWGYAAPASRVGDAGMKRLRHVAAVTKNQPEMARFYTEAFGMKVVPKGKEGGRSLHLSDGAINFTILCYPADDGVKEKGFHHTGFTFERDEFADRPGLDKKFRAAGASSPVEETEVNAGQEWRVADPDGNDIDLAPVGRWNY